jgi:hypothetical protein
MSPRIATTDPDLRLEIDGRSIGPDNVADGLYRFTVGPRASHVRLVSRALVPAREPDHGDQRRLGVALLRIALLGETLELFLPHDDPSLVEGFHPAEAGHRWTDGRAVIPSQWLLGLQSGFVLEVQIRTDALRYPLSG